MVLSKKAIIKWSALILLLSIALTVGGQTKRIRPVTEHMIVKAKFAMVFIAVTIYVGGCCIAFALVSTGPDYLIPSSAYVIVYGALCLVVAGFLYLGIFRHGFSRFGKYILIAWVVLLTSPIPIRILILKPRGISDPEIMQFFRGPYWIIGTIVCLTGYYVLMKLAVKKLCERYV